MKEEHRLQIGKRIETIRKHKGMTRKAVATAMHKQYQWLWNIETGRRVPSVPVALALAELFDVTADELLTVEGDHAA